MSRDRRVNLIEFRPARKLSNCSTDTYITKEGNVWSTHYSKWRKWNILKDGYCKIAVYYNSGRKLMAIHRLVAMTYLPNSLNSPQVDHKDGDRKNNRLDNLEWVTASENNKRKFSSGRVSMTKGEECSWSKLTKEQVKEIREVYKGRGDPTQQSLADKYKVSRRSIGFILKGETWRDTYD